MLDGVGDLPHPDLAGKTPLEAATTKNMDILAKNGIMGQVISVGKGIAPESDIAVFNMLGYKFQHSNYAGRGVIEAIGIGIDFKDGDLALRGNFATLDDEGKIIDRRAGRRIEREDVEKISKEIEKEIKFSNPNTTVVVAPTVGHRVTIRLRDSKSLSSEISNTDPAYARVDGMGIAKAVSDFMKIEKCIPLEQTENAANAANLVNEFTKQSLEIMKKSDVNKQRSQKNKKLLNSILLRDAGNKYPNVKPINDLHSMNFSCIVDMPVEIGISNILKMKAFNAGGLTDYEEKARVAAQAMETENAIYVHLKGPDEFGHDGDAIGKMKNIEEIDERFFGTLLDHVDVSKIAIMISADHSTPSIHKGHSDDPVPLLISGNMITNDDTQRFTETEAKKGAIGLIDGVQVVKTGIDLFKT
uniref:Phosphoglycerate mutase (ApgM) n=1 Tax=uncultured marine thaumarchaeote SAT1000_11_C10 TaxID=1456377 RepID=A0A075I2U8_9ARCH|nr:phosphoglycerate mutase (apgM) [uncultured marine thaumarchaeote SAT1000_11_C10]